MQVLTARRTYQIREHHHNHYVFRCSVINSNAHKAGVLGGDIHSLQIVEAAYDYAHRVFHDLLEVERNGMRGRVFPPWRKSYFSRLTSLMRNQFQADFWEAVNEQLESTPLPHEAGGHENPLKTAMVQEQLEKLGMQMNVLVCDSVNAMREEFKQDRIKATWTTIPKLIAFLMRPVKYRK